MGRKLNANPCREGSVAHAIVSVLLRAQGKAVAGGEIAKRTRLKEERVRQVLNALLNPFHNAAIAKAGLAIKRSDDGGFSIAKCKPNPKAHRPEPKKRAKAVQRKSKAKTAKRQRVAVKPPAAPVAAPQNPHRLRHQSVHDPHLPPLPLQARQRPRPLSLQRACNLQSQT